ncbi:CHAP domain-containing protein [Actinomadura roseirufa]|uniref:CHAP domain-containing protein n=1 Tax=Actinomadura roseirufa TaxID=2094049 RepID=UPI001F5F9A2A|nr:CHAP domain-containing protein [Actinomadura roseirufa]
MSGKHRRIPFPLTWRTTSGVLAGVAVLGTAAATAQTPDLDFGSDSAKPVSADLMVAKSTPKHGSKSRSARKARAKRSAAASSRSSRRASARTAKPTAADAIKIARSQVGIEEDGNGETKFQQWYMGTSRARQTVARDGGSIGGYSSASWCDMFVSWVGDRIGFSNGVGKDAWTVAHAGWFKERGRWGGQPRPGSIVFFSWGGSRSLDDIDHVGMVIKKNGDGTIQTVEGNTSNAVRIRTRSTGTVVGYGYPEYAS